MRMLAEIASDESLLVLFNHAIDSVISEQPKARANPEALAQLDGYRPLVSSLSAIFSCSEWRELRKPKARKKSSQK